MSITGGPGQFTCTGLTITAPLAGAGSAGAGSSDPGTAGPGTSADAPGVGSSGGTTVRCAVPAAVKVFSGLAAEITIAGGKAENVLTVPTTAVKGSAQSGVVWLVTKQGTPQKHDVKLGLTDGKNVQITDGVAAGDEILQFVPGAPVPQGGEGQNCTPEQGGGMVCSGVGG